MFTKLPTALRSGVRRWNWVAGLLILFGLLWFVQGIGVLMGSMMSGQIQWAIFGGAAVLQGMVRRAGVAPRKGRDDAAAPPPPLGGVGGWGVDAGTGVCWTLGTCGSPSPVGRERSILFSNDISTVLPRYRRANNPRLLG